MGCFEDWMRSCKSTCVYAHIHRDALKVHVFLSAHKIPNKWCFYYVSLKRHVSLKCLIFASLLH